MSHDDILRDIAGKLPVTRSGRKMLWFACMAVGAISFAMLIATNPLRGWGAWAINTLFWLGAAMAMARGSQRGH